MHKETCALQNVQLLLCSCVCANNKDEFAEFAELAEVARELELLSVDEDSSDSGKPSFPAKFASDFKASLRA